MNILTLLINIIGFIIIYFLILNIVNYISLKSVLSKINAKKYIIYNLSFLEKCKNYLLSIFYGNKYLGNFNLSIIILFASLFFSMITYIISYKFLKIFSTSMILCLYGFCIPYIIISNIYKYEKRKIVKEFPNFLINLKNYTKVDNDIIIALRQVKIKSKLMNYIDEFNVLVKNGINVYEAFEKLKQRINIEKINEFFSALQVCFLNGGNYTNILDRYIDIISKANIQKEKESQENFSSIIVLIILIFINIFMFFSFVVPNNEYFFSLTKTMVGHIILNINILSYLIIYYFVVKINKMEE